MNVEAIDRVGQQFDKKNDHCLPFLIVCSAYTHAKHFEFIALNRKIHILFIFCNFCNESVGVKPTDFKQLNINLWSLRMSLQESVPNVVVICLDYDLWAALGEPHYWSFSYNSLYSAAPPPPPLPHYPHQIIQGAVSQREIYFRIMLTSVLRNLDCALL